MHKSGHYLGILRLSTSLNFNYFLKIILSCSVYLENQFSLNNEHQIMKYTFTFLFSCLFALASFGQLPDNFIAPDFTVTDLNGNQHNLYEILDQEKTVIIDIYATWCGPCWTFHEEHVLADIWEELGPDGTDEVFIMSIESDLETTQADLEGTTGGTQGDWITGTPYPMIDEMEGVGDIGQIGTDYHVWGYPTVYFICPDRSVTEVNWQDVSATYSNVIQSCPTAQGQNNGKLIEYIGVEGVVCEAQTFTPKATFQNRGDQIMTAATFAITINGATEEVNWSGSLNPFAIDEVEFSSVAAGNTDITIELINVNNVADEFPDDNTLTSSIIFPSATQMQTVTVEIMTDEYGAETYWAILDENDEIVATGGNQLVGFDVNIDTEMAVDAPADPSAYEPNTLYTTDVLLASNGCHKFAIADYYLDGICCDYGDGYFKVISQDNGVLVDGTGTTFTDRSDNPFVFDGPVGIQENVLTGLEIYPNPLMDELTITLPENSANVNSIEIHDLHGKTIFSTSNFNTAERKIQLDLSVLQSGLYLIEVTLEDGSIGQQKLIKE